MRRAARTDATQEEIVICLRLIGVSVQLLHTVGQGCPDAAIGWRGKTWLVEFKADETSRYTPDQLQWRENWQGEPPLRFNGAGDAMAWAKGVSALEAVSE
jgi:hypothetical protein